MVRKKRSLRALLEDAMEGMGPFTPLTEAAETLCMICLKEVVGNIEGTIVGEDPEYLHDMRVASRRLRAALRVFGACFQESLEETKLKAKYITDLLGLVRDLDVRMIHLKNIKALVGPEAERAADLLILTSSMQWEQARDQMISGLKVIGNGRWYKWMEEVLTDPRIPDGKGWAPSVHSLPIIMDNRLSVISGSHLAGMEEALAGQHMMRIWVKKYRYSLELLKFCFSNDIEKVLKKCKTIQDDLGLMHDYDILQQHIQSCRSRTLPKNIKKGMDELKATITNLRHQQFELFIEHLGPFLELDPLEYKK